MLLFKPILLDARLLKELVPIGGRSEVDFWLVNDPLVNLNRGHLVEHAQLAVLIRNPIELQILGGNGDSAPILKELLTRYQNEVANKLLEEEEI